MLSLDQIVEISKESETLKGYKIVFNDGRAIYLKKRRCIPALLTLIKFGEGCESDLTSSTTNLQDIKKLLKGKIPENLILDSYSDANKPFSELWNEEGFNFIENPVGQTRNGSKKYVLHREDHEKLFTVSKKAERKPPSNDVKVVILEKQNHKCNFCNNLLKEPALVESHNFAKDRIKLVWDHRVPVEMGGDSLGADNYQALCFMCNKHKWMICNICELGSGGCSECALAFPEERHIVAATNEDVSDRLYRHHPK